MEILVPNDIQEVVEELIETHAQLKELETKVKRLREIVEPFMKLNELGEIIGVTQVGKILLGTQDRPHITAQYTYYNAPQVIQMLSPEARGYCVVNLVDKDALEALVTLKQVPEDVLNFKVLTTISRLTVMHRI